MYRFLAYKGTQLAQNSLLNFMSGLWIIMGIKLRRIAPKYRLTLFWFPIE